MLIGCRITSALLRRCGFSAQMIAPKMDSMERSEVLANFNDEKGDVQFLVLSSAVSSAGLNLHGACHNGILTTVVWNAATLFQAEGRFFRIGQKNPITWYLVNVAGAGNDWMEDGLVRKVRRKITPCQVEFC